MEQVASLVRLKDELKTSLLLLTRIGSSRGMSEACILLMTTPLVVALAGSKEIVPAAQNFYILDLIGHLYQLYDMPRFIPYETVQPTQEEVEVGAKLSLDYDSAAKVNSLKVSIFLELLESRFIGNIKASHCTLQCRLYSTLWAIPYVCPMLICSQRAPYGGKTYRMLLLCCHGRCQKSPTLCSP